MRYIIKKRGVKVRRGVWRIVVNNLKVNKCRGIQNLKESAYLSSNDINVEDVANSPN